MKTSSISRRASQRMHADTSEHPDHLSTQAPVSSRPSVLPLRPSPLSASRTRQRRPLPRSPPPKRARVTNYPSPFSSPALLSRPRPCFFRSKSSVSASGAPPPYRSLTQPFAQLPSPSATSQPMLSITAPTKADVTSQGDEIDDASAPPEEVEVDEIAESLGSSNSETDSSTTISTKCGKQAMSKDEENTPRLPTTTVPASTFAAAIRNESSWKGG